MDSLSNFLCNLSTRIREGTKAPPPDSWDPERLPFGVAPGNNRLRHTVCATRGKPPTETGRNDVPRGFFFRDYSSATEHRISGLCQKCQDTIYGPSEEI